MKRDVNCGNRAKRRRLGLRVLRVGLWAAIAWLPSLRAADAGHGIAAANIKVQGARYPEHLQKLVGR